MKPVTLQDVFKVFQQHGKLYSVLGLTAVLVSVVAFTFVVPYQASGVILSHDSQNSGVQAFVESFSGLQKSLSDGRKGNTSLTKKIEFLKSQEFSQKVAQKLTEMQKNETQLSEELRVSLAEILAQGSDEQLTRTISESLKIQLDSDFEVRVLAKHLNPKVAYGISKVATEEAQLLLKDLEASDLKKVKKFVEDQIQLNEGKLKEISKKMASYQDDDQAVLPLASQERISEYASELIVREQELKLKIAENNKMIEILSQGKKAVRESKLYGVGGQIEGLKTQNTISRNQLRQTQVALKKIRQQTKSLPFEKLIYEDLKKRSEVEFGKYKELADVESKLSAQMISVDSKFEIFKYPELQTTQPAISLFKLLGLSAILSFLIGSAMIYLKFMLTQEEQDAVQGTRDVMVFRDHSFDPSVILENSKIRFSLQKFLEESAEKNQDSSGPKIENR